MKINQIVASVSKILNYIHTDRYLIYGLAASPPKRNLWAFEEGGLTPKTHFVSIWILIKVKYKKNFKRGGGWYPPLK